MPFPILRTPFVVVSEIISLLEPNEIVTASFCSKNVNRLLEMHHKRIKPLEWRLIMGDSDSTGRVGIMTPKVLKPIPVILAKHISELKGRKFKKQRTQVEKWNGYIKAFINTFPVIFFNDQVLGTKWIVNYVTRLFSIDVFGLTIDRNGIWAIDWINNRQEKMLECFQWDRNRKYNSNADKTLDYVLRNARVSLDCNIDDNVSDNFKFNGKLGPMRELKIRSNGHWVTCDNLMNFDCLFILIEESRLSVSDLNSFLRYWRAGGSPRLEWLRLNFEEHTFQERFDEDLEVVKTNEERVYRRSCDGWERVFNGGYSIQRVDGVTAMITCTRGRFLMVVLHERETENGISRNLC